MKPTADDLLMAANLCAQTLKPAVDADWSAQAGSTEWTCRQTLEHVCGLAFAPQLATRAEGLRPLALQIASDASIAQLQQTMHAMAVILAEVARAAPPTARAFHPAGMADPSGWVAMGMDELLVHTHDIAGGLGLDYQIEADLAQLVLDRLFPWWPRGANPQSALLWANGRADLPQRPSPGDAWLWHCAPLAEWDGTVPRWDAAAKRPVAH
jgi:hypothetical protein